MGLFKDRELDDYSRVMEAPERQEDGFSLRVAICAFFIGVFMLPGVMYLNLVIGQALGDAGRWVAVILFMEMLRKSRSKLRAQELYVLFSMAGMMMSSPFAGLLWQQYLRQSPFLVGTGLADQLPAWVAPPASSDSYAHRTFFHVDWSLPIALIAFRLFISRVDQFGLGLALYHLTAKVEKLPFPMAPIGAMGTIALVENPEEKGAWKWRAFSVGAAIGVVWGVLYIGVPIVTELALGTRFELFPIPWVETSAWTEQWLPATPTGITLDLSLFVLGLVIPFWAVIGSVIGAVLVMALNPILHHLGVLKMWRPGMDTVQTSFANSVDFYFSFGIGLSLAIAAIGITQAVWSLHRARRGAAKGEDEAGGGFAQRLRENRFGIGIGVGIYLFSALCYGVLVKLLVPSFPVAFLLVYGVVYVPFISYVTARMEGLAGRAVEIPFIREASFILSGTRDIGIWFAPIPVNNYGYAAITFRQMELTGTRLRSIIYSELVAVPVIIVFSLLASQFIWQMAEAPSQAFPFAEKMWELNVRNQAILWSATSGGESLFRTAWSPTYLLIGLGGGLAMAGALGLFNLPMLLFYGVIGGLSASMPHGVILMLFGALFARFYLWKKYGKDNWLRMAPVVAAGFGCGFGLAGMFSFGMVLIQKTVTALPW